MTKLTGLSGVQTLGISGAALGVVAAVGLYASGIFTTPRDQSGSADISAPDALEPSEPPSGPSQTAFDAAAPDQSADDDEGISPSPQATPDIPELPTVSTFLLDADGRMIVAGRTAPGWETAIRLDEDELSRFQPEANGEFVKFVTVAPSDAPRILTLSMRSPEDGSDVVSKGEIIIAPLRAPETTAKLDTLAAPEPAQKVPDISTEIDPDTAADSAAAETQETAPSTPAESAPATAAGPDIVADAPESPAIPDAPATGSDTPVPSTDSVASAAPAAVLLNDAEGLQVLQPALSTDPAPEVMATVALDAISYSDEGDVLLAGRGVGEGFVRVYLDNAPVITSAIAEDGRWRSELPEVDTGVYTLRIDEVDEDGNVTSRIETPFKRESDDVLAAATRDNRPIQAVIVQPGYTLWGISRRNYGDGFQYVRIFEANRDRIRDPDLIYPGQLFSIPQE